MPSASVTVTIDRRCRVCRFVDGSDRRDHGGLGADLQAADRGDAGTVDVATRVVVQQLADGLDAERLREHRLRLGDPSTAIPFAGSRADGRSWPTGEASVSGIGGSSRWGRFYHGVVTRPGVPRSVLAVAALLTLAGCTSGASQSASIPATNAASASLLPTTADALPPMDPSGLKQLLDQLKGTPVVVNFWASWCEPCKTETPLLVAAHRRDGDRVQFLGVDVQDSAAGARRFIAQQDMTYPSVFDPCERDRDRLQPARATRHVLLRRDGEVGGELARPALRAGSATEPAGHRGLSAGRREGLWYPSCDSWQPCATSVGRNPGSASR